MRNRFYVRKDKWSLFHKLFTVTLNDGREIDLTWWLWGIVVAIVLLLVFV